MLNCILLLTKQNKVDYKKLGQYGEDIACKYLQEKGYRILERNFYKESSAVSKGEIDIICKKGKVISFVEVKTSVPPRRDGSFSPEDRVNFQKQRKLKNLSLIWLSKNKISFESPWQIDVISVVANVDKKTAKIRHFQNAVE